MTQEQKAKAYDEAIERAKKVHDEHRAQPFDVMLKVFPELQESENEKVRKSLIDLVINYGDRYGNKQNMLAWLEKQSNKTIITPQWMIDFLDEHRRHFSTPMDYDERKETDEKLLCIKEWLEKAMTDAGYTFDFEKEKLKKIEHNIQLTEFEDAVKDMMNDYRDAIGDNDATIEEVKKHAEYLLSLIPCKPAWSEEDSVRLQRIIAFLWHNRKGDTDTIYQQEQDINWLKSLKERVQPKIEWSEEDIRNIENIDSVLFYDKNLPEDTCVRLRNWLKSLRKNDLG